MEQRAKWCAIVTKWVETIQNSRTSVRGFYHFNIYSHFCMNSVAVSFTQRFQCKLLIELFIFSSHKIMQTFFNQCLSHCRVVVQVLTITFDEVCRGNKINKKKSSKSHLLYRSIDLQELHARQENSNCPSVFKRAMTEHIQKTVSEFRRINRKKTLSLSWN